MRTLLIGFRKAIKKNISNNTLTEKRIKTLRGGYLSLRATASPHWTTTAGIKAAALFDFMINEEKEVRE